jgi:hypothetical protein
MIWRFLSLIVFVFAIGVMPANGANKWIRYTGHGGVSVDFPTDIFINEVGPTTKGDGVRLQNINGGSELAIYTLKRNMITPRDYLRANLAVDPATIRYERVTNKFFALSSARAGRIYYSRCNFGRAIQCIYITYPETERSSWLFKRPIFPHTTKI